MGGASARYGGVAQLGERTVRIRKVKGSIPSVSTNKKNVPLSTKTKVRFLSDAFLRNMMRTSCVMQTSSVMHAFGAWVKRIASPITAQLHHLSLICKAVYHIAQAIYH